MLSCQSQNIQPMEPIIDNKFEKIDSLLYTQLKNTNKLKKYDNENNYIELRKYENEIVYKFTPKNSNLKILKTYNLKGDLLVKGLTLNLPWPTFQKGTWYEFDEQGNLIKETNYDEPYKFTFEDVLQFCEKENIKVDKGPILQSTGYHTLIMRYIDDDSNKPCWQIYVEFCLMKVCCE